MSQFYLCTVKDCNKKYKTEAKFKDHMLKVHQQIVETAPEPVEITKNNKKAVEGNRNHVAREQQMQEFRRIALEKQQLEAAAREQQREAEAARYRAVEQEDLRLHEERLRLREEELRIQAERIHLQAVADSQTAAFEETCRVNAARGEECCICMAGPRDTAAVPCGHKLFCYDCINDYHRGNPNKGCPYCRASIVLVSKIFG